MTATQMIPAVGTQVEIKTGVGTVTVLCDVRDVKTVYGSIRLLVSPVAGSGNAWVEMSRIRAIPGQPKVRAVTA